MLHSTFWRGLVLAWLLVPVVACGDGAPSSDDTVDDPDAAVDEPDATVDEPDAMPDAVDAPIAADADGCDGAGNTFTWSLVDGASYQLEYTPVGGAPVVVELAVGVSSYEPAAPLPLGATAWRIRARIDDDYSAYAEATLTVRPLPAAPSIAPIAEVCSGDAMTLEASEIADATYAWTGPDGFTATGRVVEASAAAGTYTVAATVAGCTSASAELEVEFDSTAFAQDLAAEFLDGDFVGTSLDGDTVTLFDMDVGDGSDGALTVTVDSTLAGGVYQFTDVSIAAGATLTVIGDQPLQLRASGTVAILGTLRANGAAGSPGVTFSSAGIGATGAAGGRDGGDGTFSAAEGPLLSEAGAGPGGSPATSGWSGGGGAGHLAAGTATGSPNGGVPGVAVDSLDVGLLLGGSGGAGGSGGYNCGSGGGGAGGGAIRIVAPSIVVDGTIAVRGGDGGSDGLGNCGGGGGGAGGTVWLSAASTTFGAAAVIDVRGGGGGASQISGSPYYGTGGAGATGRFRLDSPDVSGTPSTAPISTTSGTLVSPVITRTCTWGALSLSYDAAADTTVEVDVLDESGTPIVFNVGADAILDDLVDVAAASAIRLRAVLRSDVAGRTPVLDRWTLAPPLL
jgi:hypothetical protein